MLDLLSQWWHGRVLRHYQWSTEVYVWPLLAADPQSTPSKIRIECACGAVWMHGV